MTSLEPAPLPDAAYRDKLVAIEPGGNEFIALEDRHGNPRQLFRTWASPNLEFATIFIGVLAVAAYGMTFRQAVVGIVVGAGLGAIAHYFLSARGRVHICAVVLPPGEVHRGHRRRRTRTRRYHILRRLPHCRWVLPGAVPNEDRRRTRE